MALDREDHQFDQYQHFWFKEKKNEVIVWIWNSHRSSLLLLLFMGVDFFAYVNSLNILSLLRENPAFIQAQPEIQDVFDQNCW